MFSESTELYDLIYDQFKDYEAEASRVADLIRSGHPDATSVLDVACGTGRHAALLHERHGFTVDGVDLEPGFVTIARERHPAGTFTVADMAEFALDRRYDIVLSLFSSIGYAGTLDRLRQSIQCMAAHLKPDGLLIVEPWFAPGQMTDRYVTMQTGERDGLRVCRVSYTRIDGRTSRIRFHYLVADRDGIRHAEEHHELGLFTVDEMTGSFHAAGLEPAYDPEGLTGRGLYLARVRADSG